MTKIIFDFDSHHHRKERLILLLTSTKIISFERFIHFDRYQHTGCRQFSCCFFVER